MRARAFVSSDILLFFRLSLILFYYSVSLVESEVIFFFFNINNRPDKKVRFVRTQAGDILNGAFFSWHTTLVVVIKMGDANSTPGALFNVELRTTFNSKRACMHALRKSTSTHHPPTAMKGLIAHVVTFWPA